MVEFGKIPKQTHILLKCQSKAQLMMKKKNLETMTIAIERNNKPVTMLII